MLECRAGLTCCSARTHGAAHLQGLYSHMLGQKGDTGGATLFLLLLTTTLPAHALCPISSSRWRGSATICSMNPSGFRCRTSPTCRAARCCRLSKSSRSPTATTSSSGARCARTGGRCASCASRTRSSTRSCFSQRQGAQCAPRSCTSRAGTRKSARGARVWRKSSAATFVSCSVLCSVLAFRLYYCSNCMMICVFHLYPVSILLYYCRIINTLLLET